MPTRNETVPPADAGPVLSEVLGPLPEPAYGEDCTTDEPAFTAEQMRDYAIQERGAWQQRCEKAELALAAIDRHSVNTLRTNSKDRGDWAEDVAFMGKLARGH